jgi:hypothetical protein
MDLLKVAISVSFKSGAACRLCRSAGTTSRGNTVLEPNAYPSQHRLSAGIRNLLLIASTSARKLGR